MPKCPRNTLKRMFRRHQPTARLSSKADLLVPKSLSHSRQNKTTSLMIPSRQMYLNYVMFVEKLAEKASEAAQAEGSSLEAYHVEDVSPVRTLCPPCSLPLEGPCALTFSYPCQDLLKEFSA